MLRRLRSTFSRLTEWLNPKLSDADARISFFAVVVGLACVLAIGPFLQLYSFALITSDETSVYSTAYSSGVVDQPALGDWLASLPWPQFLAMALSIALCLRAEHFRSAFIRLAGVSFVVLMVCDLVMQLAAGELLSAETLQCLAANLIGGPLVAAILLGMVALSEWLSVALRDHGVMRSVLVPFAPVLGGLALVFFSYYLITLFYKPTESRFSIRAKPSIYAFYGALPTERAVIKEIESSGSGEESNKERFQMYGAQVSLPAKLYWEGEAEELDVSWKNESGSEYDLEVRAFDGCPGGAKTSDLVKVKPLRFDQVGQLSIAGDDGSMMVVVGLQDRSGYFNTTQNDLGMFWLLEDKDKEQKRIFRTHKFLDKDAQLMYWNPTGALDVSITRLLIDRNGEGPPNPAKKSLSLFVDGKKLEISLSPDQSAEWGGKLGCRGVKISESSSTIALSTKLYAGIHLSLIPRDKTIRTTLSRRESEQLKIKGVSGWLVADGIAEDDVEDFFTSGGVSLFGVGKGMEMLEVNDEEIDVDENDTAYVTSGEFAASIKEEVLVVEGKAAAIYKNEERVNKTRWERLDWPARAVLFGGIPSVVVWLLSLFLMTLKANKVIGARLGFKSNPQPHARRA